MITVTPNTILENCRTCDVLIIYIYNLIHCIITCFQMSTLNIESTLWKETVLTLPTDIKMLKKGFDFLVVLQRNEGTSIPHGKSQWK
jgi:hypothetical protein